MFNPRIEAIIRDLRQENGDLFIRQLYESLHQEYSNPMKTRNPRPEPEPELPPHCHRIPNGPFPGWIDTQRREVVWLTPMGVKIRRIGR